MCATGENVLKILIRWKYGVDVNREWCMAFWRFGHVFSMIMLVITGVSMCKRKYAMHCIPLLYGGKETERERKKEKSNSHAHIL